MQVANPIYDVVFKYMMEDNEVATLILSALIGKEIIDLSFHSTEYPDKKPDFMSIMRMDFAATIKHEDGSQKRILIELQKAKYIWGL